tara:strand:- start:376 stop:522 length:147 start_codon:yes stop_codon:yes gene_type:complete
MEGAVLIDAINAGGNLGLLMMGVYMMRLTSRVNRLEIMGELQRKQYGN